MSLLSLLRSRFAPVLSSMSEDVGPLLDMIRPAQDARFGDYQANFAMPLSKKLNRPPRDIATEVIAQLQLDDLCEPPEIAGPGFINLRLRNDWLAARLTAIADDVRLGVSLAQQPRHVVVDYSGPNVAKPMHVGHLRSTVIGDAICRILRFAGHRVTSDNHIGDWGTQFGMIIYGYRHFRDEAAYAADAVSELSRLYRLVNQLSDYHSLLQKRPALQQALQLAERQVQDAKAADKDNDRAARKQLGQFQRQVESARQELESAESVISQVESREDLLALARSHPEIARDARRETAKLHAGDPENLQLWNEFLPACLRALHRVYDRLGIQFDLELGESYYNPMLAGVVDSLRAHQLATNSDGAVCVFIEGNRAPFIVQKTDGAYTYATTDLATIQYRHDTLQASELVYVVDKRQSEHFQLLFGTAQRWKFADMRMQHVSFGTVMGKDGKPYKTRSGDNVGLESLIDEAMTRARAIVDENDDRRETAVLSAEQRARVAEIVGIGGIKYADLHHNRDSDYTFDWDKMLATTGDTAAYMQYAFARICGIFRRLRIERESVRQGHSIVLSCPEERALALQLLQFPDAIEGVLMDYRPHQLTAWLFETADRFSRFYDRCSVQDAESRELQYSRLLLCDLMARSLQTGLSLLGIETAEVM